jgi:tetratricopeptide (TPR) repeat protein
MDADDVMVLPDGFDVASFKQGLTQDFYHVEIRYEPIRFWRAQLMRNRIEFRYRGVLHEFVVGPPTVTSSGTTSGLYIREGADGARSRSSEKHLDDIRTLERALETETNEFIRARYVFYLAQTWRNAGEHEKALQLYLRRATLGQFQAEVFVSLYRAAQLKEELGYHAGEVVGSYLNAYEADPMRAESLHGAMDYCRRKGKHHQGYLIGKQAVTMTEPPGALFSEPWIYDYGLLEEFSVAAFHSGHFQECITAINKLLDEGKIPQEAHERLRQNAQEARERLKARQ